jgi:hypothetical protein
MALPVACRGLGVARAILIAAPVLTGGVGANAGTARIVERPDLGVSLIQFDGQIAKGDRGVAIAGGRRRWRAS